MLVTKATCAILYGLFRFVGAALGFNFFFQSAYTRKTQRKFRLWPQLEIADVIAPTPPLSDLPLLRWAFLVYKNKLIVRYPTSALFPQIVTQVLFVTSSAKKFD